MLEPKGTVRKVTLDNQKSGKKISGAMSNTFLLWLLKTCITELLNITPLQLEDPRYSPTNLLFPCSVIQNRAGSPESPANPQDGSVKYGKSGQKWSQIPLLCVLVVLWKHTQMLGQNVPQGSDSTQTCKISIKKCTENKIV